MIREITELNFPKYATLNKATVTHNDMGEKTIATEIAIDGDIKPDFSHDWEVEFKGEKYIMPLRKPAGTKANDSRNSKINLTFQHWAIYQLKRWYFFTLASENAGVAVADKYIASVSLNLKNFCDLYSQLLQHYFGDTITIDLNPDWVASEEPVYIDINHSYMWDVLIKIYELFAVRWEIVPNGSSEKYVIRVGYETRELDHIFEYGYEGGLLKIERQVQDENIRNMLLGRGGDKNIPYRYFKNVDPNNPDFPADPDWIPELANVYFDRLRSAEFRSYVQGWKYKHYTDELENSRYVAAGSSKVPWAWARGWEDEKFNPVEFVKDNASIAKYGELMGGLDDNDEIYPTIQGIQIDGLGRIDQAVDVEQVVNDVPEVTANDISNFHIQSQIDFPKAMSADYTLVNRGEKVPLSLDLGEFEIKSGLYGIAYDGILTTSNLVWNGDPDDANRTLAYYNSQLVAVNKDGKEISSRGIEAGVYTLRLKVEIENPTKSDIKVKLVYEGAYIQVGDYTHVPSGAGQTFDVWIKNVWQTKKGVDKEGNEIVETDVEYAHRVWDEILGNHLGEDAAVVFTTGWLSTSEDYEFRIVAFPVYDTSKSLNGVPSHWRLTLERSNADYETLGKYVPNLERQGKAGDCFFFIGINLTQYYVDWAEERLYNYKLDQLDKVKDINPSWAVTLDKVRIGTPQYDDAYALIDQLRIGGSIRLADKRFITEEGVADIPLYLQTITYKFNEQANKANFTPDVDIVLGTEYVTSANPVANLQGSVDAIYRQLGSTSFANIQQIVRQVGDKIYLRKDGLTDRSLSPTYFASIVASLGFRQGLVGGKGYGFFTDENGRWVLELDRLNVREEMQVNTLVINQIQARGGMIIESAASIEVSFVEELQDRHRCYFDIKGGSVANLFRVSDIAYCHRWKPNNDELKLYKRVVVAVGDDYIDIAKTPSYGGGEPEEGDVIVQYGNTSPTQKERQFVIIRDVVGGGYERMLSNLNSVNAQGDEYFFAGYQSSNAAGNRSSERFFIGDKSSGQYIEYKDGKLYIPGQLILGPDGDSTMLDYLQGLINESKSDSERYADEVVKEAQEYLQDQIDGAIETWFYEGVPTLQNEPAVNWKTDADKRKHLGDLYYDQTSGYGYRFQYDQSGNFTWELIRDTGITEALAKAAEAQDTADHKRRVFLARPVPPYDEGDLWVNATYTAGPTYLNDILRCKEGIHKTATDSFAISDWGLASKYTDDTTANQALNEIAGYEYIKEALGSNGRTEIEKGLVLSQLIQLGVWSGSNLTVWSGINGLYSTYGSTGIAAWFGGDMKDGEKQGWTGRPAKTIFRFDGSGYLANGNIYWDVDGAGGLAGGKITFGKDGSLSLANEIKISGTEGETLGTIVNFLNNMDKWFYPVDKAGNRLTWSDSNIFAIKTTKGFYSDSFISAMGMNSSTGGGGGSSINYLDELKDVTITSPSKGQVLIYNNGQWVNSDLVVQEIDQSTDKVPSSNAVRNAISNRSEGLIQIANFELWIRNYYTEKHTTDGPHIYQLASGANNLGTIIMSGDGTNSILNLLLITRINITNGKLPTGSVFPTTSPTIKIYSATFASNSLSDWTEITGGSGGSGTPLNYDYLKQWVGYNDIDPDNGDWDDNGSFWDRFVNMQKFIGGYEDPSNPSNWYDGLWLKEILQKIRNFIGLYNWNVEPPKGEDLAMGVSALAKWTGIPSFDPGDWDEDTLYDQVQHIVIPVDKVFYGNTTDSGTIDKSAWAENRRYQVYLNMSDSRIYLRDNAMGRYYSKWNGYERWKPSSGEYYEHGVYVCFSEAQVVVYDRAEGEFNIIAGSMFMKKLSHENPQSTSLGDITIPYLDEGQNEVNAKVMSLSEVKSLLNIGNELASFTNLSLMRTAIRSGTFAPHTPTGVIVSGYNLGNVRIMQLPTSPVSYIILLETWMEINSAGTINSNSDSSIIRTYTSRLTGTTWSNWKLVNSIDIS